MKFKHKSHEICLNSTIYCIALWEIYSLVGVRVRSLYQCLFRCFIQWTFSDDKYKSDGIELHKWLHAFQFILQFVVNSFVLYASQWLLKSLIRSPHHLFNAMPDQYQNLPHHYFLAGFLKNECALLFPVFKEIFIDDNIYRGLWRTL